MESFSRALLASNDSYTVLEALESSRFAFETSDRAQRILHAKGYEQLLNVGAAEYGLSAPKPMYSLAVEGVGCFGLYLLFGLHPEALLPWMSQFYSTLRAFCLISHLYCHLILLVCR